MGVSLKYNYISPLFLIFCWYKFPVKSITWTVMVGMNLFSFISLLNYFESVFRNILFHFYLQYILYRNCFCCVRPFARNSFPCYFSSTNDWISIKLCAKFQEKCAYRFHVQFGSFSSELLSLFCDALCILSKHRSRAFSQKLLTGLQWHFVKIFWEEMNI